MQWVSRKQAEGLYFRLILKIMIHELRQNYVITRDKAYSTVVASMDKFIFIWLIGLHKFFENTPTHYHTNIFVICSYCAGTKTDEKIRCLFFLFGDPVNCRLSCKFYFGLTLLLRSGNVWHGIYMYMHCDACSPWRRFCEDRGLHPLWGTLSRRGLNPIKLAYNPSQPDGRLR